MGRSQLFRTYENDANATMKILKRKKYKTKDKPEYSERYQCWVVYYLPKEEEK